jgi:hypothetical protein
MQAAGILLVHARCLFAWMPHGGKTRTGCSLNHLYFSKATMFDEHYGYTMFRKDGLPDRLVTLLFVRIEATEIGQWYQRNTLAQRTAKTVKKLYFSGTRFKDNKVDYKEVQPFLGLVLECV